MQALVALGAPCCAHPRRGSARPGLLHGGLCFPCSPPTALPSYPLTPPGCSGSYSDHSCPFPIATCLPSV